MVFQLKETNLRTVITLLFSQLAISQDFYGEGTGREDDLAQVQYSAEQETIHDLRKTQHVVPGAYTSCIAGEEPLTPLRVRRGLTVPSQQHPTHDSSNILLSYPLH
jgi:hypothetical protein